LQRTELVIAIEQRIGKRGVFWVGSGLVPWGLEESGDREPDGGNTTAGEAEDWKRVPA
jgi:hypothetical protein